MSRKQARSTPRILAVDLFCGVGGLTHGLERGGVEVVAGVDVDPSCRFPYEINNKAKFVAKDVNKLTDRMFKGWFDDDGALTLLAGCAPCQPFSTYSQFGRQERESSDWTLVATFGRIVKRLQPTFVTMENVPQLARHPVFKEFLGALTNYHVHWEVLECSTRGVPQTRKRLVLLASQLGPDGLTVPCVPKAATVRDTIAGLPKLAAGERDKDDLLHAACRLSSLNLKRIRASQPGGTWRDWKRSLRAACHNRESGETYPSVYGRMEWDKPAPTITTQCFGYGNGRFGHPEQDRAITLREAAMLQTFPVDYKFLDDGERVRFSSMGKLIGNAVPVKLAELIARTFVGHARKYANATKPQDRAR